jgi:valyl-tRNA synthetase
MTSELEDPTACPSCGGKVRQEEDVLDTWFSSWLWPFSTLGWPEEADDLKRYYPTSVLVTGPDIIFFWVARMIMAGLYFRDDIPFEDVYFHGMIRDETGRKMSKSLGNSPDPSDLIGEYGADALRYTMISLTPRGGDILFSEKQVHTGRNFANKVWNAARLINAASEKAGFEAGSSADREPGSELSDRWILSRTAGVTRTVSTYFEKFELNQAAKAVYDFVWHEVCDWYLEMAKERFYSDDEAARNGALTVVRRVLARSLRLLHPFMPFLTDEVWSVLSLGGKSILDGEGVDQVEFEEDALAERTMSMLTGIVEMVRNIRGEMGIHPSAGVPLYLKMAGGPEKDAILDARSYIFKMARVTELVEGEVPESEGPVATGIVENVEVAVPLGEVIDVEVEKARLSKEIERIEQLLARSRAKIDNPEFTGKAPAKIVEREREKIEQLTENAAKLKKNLSVLLGS